MGSSVGNAQGKQLGGAGGAIRTQVNKLSLN